ncbi:TonB-dependent receptor [Microbulbifer rhizosphaerae]|uniref:Iron complex outermembrane receptor protein n=1 Tax=Microbulbifer rhizosphaerae TaxID=1562603 RepID=A0A7W4W9V7_9GAMM|nr:TonB-dependent receptor [Microbulbifer rhizosphaerae]MBB3059691.1 iron complex outermembrane receptor protein [Microbulbifer rhizosphaerae]
MMKNNPFTRRNTIALAILTAAAPLTASAATREIEEVVITAERKEASIQDTAAAITAVSGEKLEQMGVDSAEDLSITTPSLQANMGGGLMQFYVRGVGTFAGNAFAENAVSFNMDGVYVSRTDTYGGLFYDLERIEVLKGPQGTLYGRNSTGGAINLLSRRPEIGGDMGGYISAEAGNYDLRRFEAAANIPVNDVFAMRAAGQKIDRDGYFDDGTSDADSTSFRLSGLYDSGDFSALVIAEAQREDRTGPGATISGPSSEVSGDFLDSDDPWNAGVLSDAVDQALTIDRGPSAFIFIPGVGPVPGPGPGLLTRGSLAQGTETSPDPGFELEAQSIVAEFNWHTDMGTFTLIPSYRESEVDNQNYVPGFLLDTFTESDQTSLEFRWAHSTDKLDWVAGMFYFDENTSNDSFFIQELPNINLAPGQTANSFENIDLDLETETAAIFAEGTYSLTDKLGLKLGARYTQEEKGMLGGTAIVNLPSDTFPVFPPYVSQHEFDLRGTGVDDEEVTWKLGLEYDIDADNFVYFTASTGFKAGGYYAEQEQFGNFFDPETITAYSLGSKNTLLDGSLRVNAELFYWDYKDHQESHLANSPGGYSTFVTENVGQATMKGLDLEVDYLLTAVDRLTLNAQLMDATFDEFEFTALSPGGEPNVGCDFSQVPGTENYVIDCSGRDAIRAPEWSFTLAYEHIFDLQENGELAFTLRTKVSGETYTGIEYLPSQKADEYTRTDVYLNYTSPSGTWNAAIWGRNLENEATINSGFLSTFTDLMFSTISEPRTFGGSVQYNF